MARIDYESFRAMSWPERVAVFDGMSAEERAEIVRTHISCWLSLHRAELTDEQIEIVEENIVFIRSEMYTFPRDENLINQYLELAKRTANVLTRDQARDALTMYWDRTCSTAAK